jgi:glucosamine-6-phosphate deaminase
VPEARKAEPVRRTLYGPVTTACPASVLRRHRGATLYLDAASASALAS